MRFHVRVSNEPTIRPQEIESRDYGKPAALRRDHPCVINGVYRATDAFLFPFLREMEARERFKAYRILGICRSRRMKARES